MSLMLIPMMVASAEEVPDLQDLKDDKIEEMMEEDRKRKEASMTTNPLLRPRLLDMIDDMVKAGVINNYKTT